MDKHNPIKILKVKDRTDKKPPPRELEPYLPDDGSVIMVVAPIAQGKSNFITGWFLHPQLAKDYYDTIYLISNTARADDTSRFLIEEPNVIVYDDLNSTKIDNIIDDIINEQKKFQKKDMPRIAIVFDDIISSMKINSKGFAISSRARHYNIISLFYVVQKFRAVSNVVRANTTHLLTFAGIYNALELKALDEEFASVGGNEGFTSMYKREVQNNKYSFLYGNLKTGKTYLNFDRLLHSNFDNSAKENNETKLDETSNEVITSNEDKTLEE